MSKKWMIAGVFAAGLCMTMGASKAAAQGPAGVGATTAVEKSSDGGHSLNPIRWVKRDSKKPTESASAKAEQEQKLTAKLQSQGVLPEGDQVATTCATFKELGDCVAALHASKNLGLNFTCVKASVTGVLSNADLSGCKNALGDKAASLKNTIHEMKPDADAKAEAKNAEKQAAEDLKEAGA
jgi:hypothetical protein